MLIYDELRIDSYNDEPYCELNVDWIIPVDIIHLAVIVLILNLNALSIHHKLQIVMLNIRQIDMNWVMPEFITMY